MRARGEGGELGEGKGKGVAMLHPIAGGVATAGGSVPRDSLALRAVACGLPPALSPTNHSLTPRLRRDVSCQSSNEKQAN